MGDTGRGGAAGIRRPEKALTARLVEGLREPGKYFDGHGLYLRVTANGSRHWVQRIVVRGRRCELGLGPLALVPLARARELALVNRRLAHEGGDPLQARREAKAVLTFEQAARRVHEMHSPTWRNAKHAAQFISTLETYAFPRLGRLRIPDVTPADVLAVLTPIWTTKAETARRVHQRIGTVMKWGIAQGWRTDNPAEAITEALPKAARTKEARKALHYEEVVGFLKALQASKAGLATKLALEFAILTAARSGEVRGATWGEIAGRGAAEAGGARGAATTATSATWTVPAARMKAKKAHRVPLAPRALLLLEEARTLSDGAPDALVFPGAKKGRPLSDMTMSKLTKELGFAVDVHGFRTSFRTWAQERTNFPREVAEFALAHVVGDGAERAYARSDVFEKRRKMMEAWAGFLAAETGKVVRLAGVGA